MANENKSPVNSNGTIIGSSDTEPLGFHGVSPIARAQVTTIAANLAGTLTGTTTGTIVNVAAANCLGGATPTAAQVDTAVDALETSTNLALKELQTKLNESISKVNSLITALQNKGVIKA